jgi:hypothetical protein
MKYDGAAIAKKIPAPEKLGKDDAEPDLDDPGEEDEDGEMEAAELSAMAAYREALKNGTDEEALAAFKDLMATCKY